jgi:hypothetical protein
MANYYSMARTNYFAVKNPDLFKEEINTIANMTGEIEIWDDRADPKKFGLGFPEGLPSFAYNEETGEEIEIDWSKVIGSHLEDDWVCIIQEIGWEKLRYLTGRAMAFNNKDGSDYITLDEIYTAGEYLGKHCTQVMY